MGSPFLSNKNVQKRIKKIEDERKRLKKEYERLDKELYHKIADTMDRCRHEKVTRWVEYDNDGYECEICGRCSSFPIKPDEKRAKEIIKKENK